MVAVVGSDSNRSSREGGKGVQENETELTTPSEGVFDFQEEVLRRSGSSNFFLSCPCPSPREADSEESSIVIEGQDGQMAKVRVSPASLAGEAAGSWQGPRPGSNSRHTPNSRQ